MLASNLQLSAEYKTIENYEYMQKSELKFKIFRLKLSEASIEEKVDY